MKNIVKAVIVIIAGALFSWLLYPLTNGEQRRLPQLFGLAAGCLLIDGALYWLYGDEQTVERSFLAQVLVGLGVAANRARLEWLHSEEL